MQGVVRDVEVIVVAWPPSASGFLWQQCPYLKCGMREAMLQLFCSNLDFNHGAFHASLVL